MNENLEASWLDIKAKLTTIFYTLSQSIDGFSDDFDPEVRVADSRFGDFQVNGVLRFAKGKGENPRELAQKLLIRAKECEELSSMELELSGPGFINIRLSALFLGRWIGNFCGRCDISQWLSGKTIVIDYSSPNTAKQMHVGHLRSMIIGESIQRLLRFCGAKVIRDNHIGDWGTQFGILIMAIKRAKVNVSAMDEATALDEFERLYREGSDLAKEDISALDEARKELLLLQRGDSENLKIWEAINGVSYRAFEEIYRQMDVTFDYVLGESFYRDKVDHVCDELESLGIAEEDNGALVVFHREHERFRTQPFLIRKSDGASNYATTDLATVLYREKEFHADEIIYVTDGRQQDHFQQLFLTVERWFPLKDISIPILKHVWFGTVLGEDGHAIKTRSGESIKLKQLMEEGIGRALAIVEEKNPSFPEEERRKIARIVAIGAIKYADLSQNRTNDYVFSWEKMLAFDGNTAPYLLYAVTRIHALFRKLALTPNSGEHGLSAVVFSTAEELALARQLINFPPTIKQVLEDLRPHYLCTYLFELASEFSSFYNGNRILGEDEDILEKRLLLCRFTLYVLEIGLHLLGIETLERM
ncbi:MAG: arginine--tRNA ligase [Puniceicoccales bacterium]|jgi:arginyl-tRNA synthetase|nr:arginine--tRNA ligase [Puniceicoccales bacterium]